VKARFFLVGQRFYQILAAGSREKMDHADTARFLASFRLMEH